MKAANIPLSKELKTNKSIQRKFGSDILKSRFKNQANGRQRIIVNANAGHVRGGHAFH
jgi:hypothetical protein